MISYTNLIKGTLVKRYKRFLADIRLDDGIMVTAHCTNSGTMLSCLEENAPVLLSRSPNPDRKTRYTWEMIYVNRGWVGVNTLVPNLLVQEAIINDKIPQLTGYESVKKEIKVGNSRIDLVLAKDDQNCYVEIKNVSMKVGQYAKFPDSVTRRGKKHLDALIDLKNQGHRAVMIYVIQRKDINLFKPAWEIDRLYAETLLNAYNHGVEIIPLKTMNSPQAITIEKQVPFELNE